MHRLPLEPFNSSFQGKALAENMFVDLKSGFSLSIVNPQKNLDMICGFAYSSQGNNIMFVSL